MDQAGYEETQMRTEQLARELARVEAGEAARDLSDEARALLVVSLRTRVAGLRAELEHFRTTALEEYTVRSAAAFAQRALNFSGLSTPGLARIIGTTEQTLELWVAGGERPGEREMNRLRALATLFVDACNRLGLRELHTWLHATPDGAAVSRYEMLVAGEYARVRDMVRTLPVDHLPAERRPEPVGTDDTADIAW